MPLWDGHTFVDATLDTRGARISAVTPGGRERLWLVPGFIDCHVHLVLSGAEPDPGYIGQQSDAEVLQHARLAAAASLLAGVTTVRDVGGWNYLEMRLREEVRRGEWPGPRMFLSGRLLSRPTGSAKMFRAMYEEVEGPAQVREAAQRQRAAGADWIKVMATGAILSPEDEDAGETQLGVTEMAAAVGVGPVAAHAHACAGIHNAIEAGVMSVEHGTWADDAALQEMARRQVALVTTRCAMLGPQRDAPIRQAMPAHMRARLDAVNAVHIDTLRRAHAAGVPLVMGTDAGTPGNRHGENAHEIISLVEEIGLSPTEALRAATVGGATLLQRSDLGRLEAGALADVVALDADPRQDLSTLLRPVWVMKGGQRVQGQRP